MTTLDRLAERAERVRQRAGDDDPVALAPSALSPVTVASPATVESVIGPITAADLDGEWEDLSTLTREERQAAKRARKAAEKQAKQQRKQAKEAQRKARAARRSAQRKAKGKAAKGGQVTGVVGGRSLRLRDRRHLYVGDVIATATLGPRSRPVRAVLSAVGIGIGITALVAVLGVPASQQAERVAEYEKWGANVITAEPGEDKASGDVIDIPDTAPAMVGRINPVKAVFTVRATPEDTYAYRNDLISAGETGGLTVWVGEGDPVGALNASFAEGEWFDTATSQLPTAVLGSIAADKLRLGVGDSIWVNHAWWAVIGVMDELPRYSSAYDAGVFLAPDWAKTQFDELKIQKMMINAQTGQAEAVRKIRAATINPAKPQGVAVNLLSAELAGAQANALEGFGEIALGLGAVALIVGGIGIANTMVVAVMERRGEIGLRRALGARTGQILLQFILEAAVIGLLGGVIGVALGAYAVFVYAAYQGYPFAIPTWVVVAGPAMAAAVGVLAGLYPTLKAARQPPTTALRTV
jgi:putative ABC transport system permease protein